MINAGSDLKFKVTSLMGVLVLTEHEWAIAVRNRWGQIKYKVVKGECFRDVDGNYYFTLENVPYGYYTAQFTAEVPDDDYDKQKRIIVDMQFLFSVGSCCAEQHRMARQCNHKVQYEQVWTVNVDDGTYLADKDGNLILTADGKRIEITKKQ